VISDLPLVDQVFDVALVLSILTSSLAVLVLAGPGWLRGVRDLFREEQPTAIEVARAHEAARRDALERLVAGIDRGTVVNLAEERQRRACVPWLSHEGRL
jgi:hypothetical protein